MTSLLDDLKKSLRVTSLDNGQVQVSVSLPARFLPLYVQLFDSLTSFLRLIERDRRLSRSKQESDFDVIHQHAKHEKEHYYQRIASLFDRYTSEGLNRNQAIKQIGADLRAEKHPWSSPDLVRSSLGPAGRPGQIGRPRRQS